MIRGRAYSKFSESMSDSHKLDEARSMIRHNKSSLGAKITSNEVRSVLLKIDTVGYLQG